MYIVKIRGESNQGFVHLVKWPQSPIFTVCEPGKEVPEEMRKLTFDAPLMQVCPNCIRVVENPWAIDPREIGFGPYSDVPSQREFPATNNKELR